MKNIGHAITRVSLSIGILMVSVVLAMSPQVCQAQATNVTFQLGCDDYAQLTIGGNVLGTVDNFSGGGFQSVFNMVPGVWYDFSLVYKNRWGSNALGLTWDQPGISTNEYGASLPSPWAVISKSSFRTSDGLGGYISGLHAEYYDLSGNLQTVVNGEGPISAGYSSGGTCYQDAYGSWAGHGGFDLFEERITGQISVPEPNSFVLVGLGLAMGGIAWKRKQQS